MFSEITVSTQTKGVQYDVCGGSEPEYSRWNVTVLALLDLRCAVALVMACDSCEHLFFAIFPALLSSEQFDELSICIKWKM